MTKLQTVCQFIESLAPLRLAEEWDNVGLLVGDRRSEVTNVMTCLTITPNVVAEAITRSADVLVTHHPLPFRATKRITTDSTAGNMLWQLIGHQVAIYSPHTAFDSAVAGINQQLAESMNLENVVPLRPIENDPDSLGSGRVGKLANPQSVQEIAATLKSFLDLDEVRITGAEDRSVQKIAIGCGSGGEFLADARRAGCDMLVTGEANFHACLEAESTGITLLLLGHYASERFAVENLAVSISTEFPALDVWASEHERTPLRTF